MKRTRMKPGKPARLPMPPAVAEAVIERAGSRCEACGFSISGRMELHHRKLRSQGGEHTEANLIYCHDSCHHTIHLFPTAAYNLGLLVRSWLEPADVPVRPFGSTVWAEQ